MNQSNWWNYKEFECISDKRDYSLSFSVYLLLCVCFTCLNVTCLPMWQILRNCYHYHYQYYCLIFANLQQWYPLWHHLKVKLSPWTQVKEMFPALSLKTKTKIPKLILSIWDCLVCCASVYKLSQTQQLNECSVHNVFQVLGLLSCLNFSSSSTFKPNMQFQGLQGIWTIQNSFIPQLVKTFP